MSLSRLAEQFERRSAAAPDPTAIVAVRRDALARFSERGLPGRTLETWHYTDLTQLGSRQFDYAPQLPDAARIARAAATIEGLALEPAAPRCVFLDGHWLESLSTVVHSDQLQIDIGHGEPSDLVTPNQSESALAALNTAFASGGARIRVRGDVERPIQLLFLAGHAGLAAQVRLRIELAPGARATVVQHFVAVDSPGESWLNLLTDIDQSEDSSLTLYRLQEFGAEQIHTSLTNAELATRARLSMSSIELGGKLIRNETEIRLAGAAAAATARGLALTHDRQHCDTRIAADHRAAQTNSRQDYRAIAADRSRSVFNGKVTVREDAQHIEARQRNDNLLLAATAEIDTKPELEIYADQVICSHGATVGELSEEHLFYLRSRGIDAETARGILTSAFAEVILGQLELEDFRERARAAVATRLPRRIELE
jgi:Fe-S cluster assembly protein SufD